MWSERRLPVTGRVAAHPHLLVSKTPTFLTNLANIGWQYVSETVVESFSIRSDVQLFSGVI